MLEETICCRLLFAMMPPSKKRSDRDNEKCQDRQRLRPWLIAMIDSGEIAGLCWLNDQHTKFQIPWKHGGKQDWSPDSGRIFMEWAKNTGRYREGIDKPNYARWKTRLRCAFNKSPEIEEIVDERHMSSSEPYRVYQLKPLRGSEPPQSVKHRVSVQPQKSDSDVEPFHMKIESEHCHLPTILAEFESSLEEQMLDDVDTNVMATDAQLFTDGNTDSVVLAAENMNLLIPADDSLLLASSAPQLYGCLPRPHGSNVCVKVRYFGRLMLDVSCKGPLCHIQYGNTRLQQTDIALEPVYSVHNMLDGCELIQLPTCPSVASINMEKVVCQLLETGLEQGFIVWTDSNGDMFAYRLCRCAVYHASSLLTSGKAVKIPLRGTQPTKIFSFSDCFLPALSSYMMGLGTRPDTDVHLFCGQSVNVTDINDSVLIRATITSQHIQSHIDMADNIVENLQRGAVVECNTVETCSWQQHNAT